VREEVNTRWGEARRSGTAPPTIFPGDTIKVLSGEEVGLVAEVLDVLGHVYSADNKVIVRNSVGDLVFYLPWDVEVIVRRDADGKVYRDRMSR